MSQSKTPSKTKAQPVIRTSGRGYAVHVNGDVIKCHNFATASFYARQQKA